MPKKDLFLKICNVYLSEPDFQLNSSRHAISRGALDDIMTALES